MSTSSELETRDLLDAITARLQSGDDIDQFLEQSEEAPGDLDEVVQVIQSLQTSLTPLNPSREFSKSLRAELLAGQPGLVKRMRQMPARVHVAAILAIFAGCVLFLLRRIFGSGAAHDVPEEAVATPL